MTTLYVQSNTLYLAGSGVLIGATSVVLTSLTDIYGNILTMANFGAIGYITLEPDTTNEEAATFTGVTANANGTYTLTGIKTILAKSPYTATSGLIRNHSGGTKVVITDNVAFWATFPNKNNNESILGKYTFDDTTNRPQLLNDTDTAVNAELVTFGQLARQAIAGAANASTTVKGLVQEATQAQEDARTTTGSTGARLFLNPGTQRSTLLSDYVVDTGAANAYVITPVPAITAYTIGQIFSFKAVNANTTTSTLNVSGLGVKTINKVGGATALVSGDIAAGMLVIVEYDGTNFIMLNPVANAPLTPTGDGSGLTNINTTSTTVFPIPVGTSGTTTVAMNTNTIMYTGLIAISSKIVVNKVSVNTSSVTGSGTISISLYSQDGATRYFSVTSGTISGTGVSSTTVSSVTLIPGFYYIGVNSNSTTNINLDGFSNVSLGAVSGKATTTGQYTITASTPPATITPTSFAALERCVQVRLDN